MTLRRAALALVTLAFVVPKCWQHPAFRTNDYDTGIYANLAWNVGHGEGFFSDVLQRNHLGEHFSPVVAVFAPLFLVWPSAGVLMLAQALAIALGFAILLRVADAVWRERPAAERRWIAPILACVFLSYRPLLSAAWSQFHPSTLGMPLLAAAILCLHRGRRVPFWLAVALLLTTKEVAVLSTAGLAIYAALVLRDRRTALALAALAAGAALAIFGLVIPYVRGGEPWEHLARIGPAADPVPKLGYLLGLLGGLAFLPLLSWRALLAAVPISLLNLSVAYPPQYSLDHHYDDQNAIFLIVAAIHGARCGLDRLERSLPAGPARRRALAAGALLAAVLALAFRGVSPARDLARSLAFAPARPLASEVGRLAAELDPGRRVIADSFLGPHLDQRRHHRTLWDDYRRLDYRPCDVVVVSPVVPSVAVPVSELLAFFRGDPRFTRTYESDVLEVFTVGKESACAE